MLYPGDVQHQGHGQKLKAGPLTITGPSVLIGGDLHPARLTLALPRPAAGRG